MKKSEPPGERVGKRGDELREHILWAAKDVFLDEGFERASMDAIAARAETSKRTLYAHFENKENLYLAVVELVRALLMQRLQHPGDYSDDPAQALVMFCGRFLEIILYAPSIRMSRMSIAQAERFPQGAASYHDAGFSVAHERLSEYLATKFALSSADSEDAAQELLGRVLHPRFTRALFGVDELSSQLGEDSIRDDLDLAPIRRAVAALLASLN